METKSTEKYSIYIYIFILLYSMDFKNVRSLGPRAVFIML
jgi:uncharacterized membrane protein